MAKPPPGLHTVTEAAKRIGVDRSTLTRWIREGHVTRTRSGPHRYYISDAEIARLQPRQECPS